MHKSKLVCTVLILWAAGAEAHHPAPGSYSERLIEPATRISFSTQEESGAAGNQSVFTTTLSGEYAFIPGHLSASLSMPYAYFAQKNRDDAGRYGKPRVSVNALPFSGRFLLGFSAGVGFPTGPDTDRFTEENYWDAGAGIQCGLRLGPAILSAGGSGVFPIGRTTARKRENSEVPFFLQRYTTVVEEAPLKKVTRWSALAAVDVTNSISLSTGFSYQTPYNGVVYETADDPYVPRIFREASAGIAWRGEALTAALEYRYPFYRGKKPDPGSDFLRAYYRQRVIGDKEFKRYHEAFVVSVSWQFDTAGKEEHNAEK